MSDTRGFGAFVPGFEFLQNLAGQAASGVAQGLGGGGMPKLSSWVAPTFNVEELEKRIEELKAVHFWLDQNTKALSATIQALEVQKMTLATLKSMNFSLGDVADALKMPAAASASPSAGASGSAGYTPFAGLEVPPRTYGAAPVEPPAMPPAPAPEAPAEPRHRRAAAAAQPAAAPASGVVDPMQWWGALSQQFQSIASQALRDAAGQMPGAAAAAGNAAPAAEKAPASRSRPRKTAAKKAPARAPAAAPRAAKASPAAAPAPAPARGRASAAPAARRAATQSGLGAGDWPLPTAFFPGFQSAPAPAAPASAPAPAPARRTPGRRR
ncbi:PhaM family polyhydroxyalkanoate granule multifunctional regulatory protein [Hydrogenophaga sp. NFH-34]|uniref:PhaM family polyhydroxyalkanoate granule multifunctional regulatory protein n=2 Tax=Hydrogenophaga TaxID=47420 RepID=UPI001F253045|nr:PhaM family polyhydroxyalkanoate granule multifunctional regulatory protein [Hydrogenophaga sp. NFH-34]